MTAEPQIRDNVKQMLALLGEDPEREGLLKTPERVEKALQFLTQGYTQDPCELIQSALFTVAYDEMVIIRDIDVYSLCEHHMLPFYGKAHVAYIPNGKVIGLSKIPRIVEMFARRLQVQERMTTEIAELLHEVLDPKGVAVVDEGAHMCAMMRGVKKSQTNMVTTKMVGIFREDRDLKNEFLEHISG